MLLSALFLVACNDAGITVHNATPEATIASPAEGTEVAEGQAITFVGSVSDPDNNDVVTATWLAGETVLCGPDEPSADGSTTCSAALSVGQETVTLVARDQDDAAGTDNVTLVVVANEQPVVTIASPADGSSFFADDLIAFEATVWDTEDDPEELAIAWESSVDGVLDLVIDPDAEGRIATSGYLSAGQHEITLSATDTVGNTGADTVLVTVRPPNTAPSCEILSPEDNSLGEAGDAVTFTGLVSDPDISADQLLVTWSSDLDGELSTASADSEGNTSFTTSSLREGTHVVTLRVEDDLGATCTDDVLYSVGTPPTVSISKPADGDVSNEGEEVSFRATVSDPDHAETELSVVWTSDLDGEINSDSPDSSGIAAFAVSTLSRGEHAVTAVVTDPDGLYARDVVTLRVNGLPEAPEITLSPDPAYTTDDLQVSIDTDVSDPESDPVSYTYEWYQDGVPRTTYTSDTLPASATARDETWRVVVTALDPYGTGGSDEAEITISNSKPTAPTVSIVPDDPIEGEDDFQCVIDVESTDDDGDSVWYAIKWKVDGSSYSDATTTDRTGDTVPAEDTTAEEEWTCTVRPSDSTDLGTSGTATVYVLGVPVDYAHTQFPCSASIARTTGTLDVYGWVYEPGVTDDYGQGAGITAEVGVGDDGTDPATDASWTWTGATYYTDQPAYGDASGDPPPYNNDEYVGTITAPSTIGDYDYAYRFSTDSGLSWVYADLVASCIGTVNGGTVDGYDPSTAGKLEVYP